jgi:streptomycin 6-kinase
MDASEASTLRRRFEERVQAWDLLVGETKKTETALLGFGMQNGCPVVLKVFRRPGDEWRSGAVLDAFQGAGVVRVYDYVDGAVLLEHLRPGSPLTDLVSEGRDDEATSIIAGVIAEMAHFHNTFDAVTVEKWGKGFERYRASGDDQVPAELVKRAQGLYFELCSSQRDARLLHGDLHHDNVLFDSERGWLGIDPKGVVGELEYEIGASLRNPVKHPELFASAATVQRRLKIYTDKLEIDADRALAWCFSQAVLSAIWSVEDGIAVTSSDAVLLLAKAVEPQIR